jgi:hypothetical protein
MRDISLAFIFIILAYSCWDQDTKLEPHFNSLTVTDSLYILRIKDFDHSLSEFSSLIDLVERQKAKLQLDSFIIYVSTPKTSRFENISPLLRKNNIIKCRYVFDEQYFKLPF